MLIIRLLYKNILLLYYYKENTDQGFASHIDQAAFCSVCFAIQGDHKESEDHFHIKISNTKKISKFSNHNTLPLKDSELIIFDRLYHSMDARSNRKFHRMTLNIYY